MCWSLKRSAFSKASPAARKSTASLARSGCWSVSRGGGRGDLLNAGEDDGAEVLREVDVLHAFYVGTAGK